MTSLRKGKSILGTPRSCYGCLRCKINIYQKAECWQEHLNNILIPTSPIQAGEDRDSLPGNIPRSFPPVLPFRGAAEELAAGTISITHDLLTEQELDKDGSEGDSEPAINHLGKQEIRKQGSSKQLLLNRRL